MNKIGPDERGTFPAGPGDVKPGTGVPHVARDRGAAVRQRHRRLPMRVLAAAGGAVTAAGVAAALLAASSGHTPSPLAAVAGALAKTSAGSYSFSLDSVVRFRGREMYSDVVSGAFDPRHGLGTERLAVRRPQGPVAAQIRFLGRYVYTQVSAGSTLGKPWDKAPVPPVAADGIPPGYEIYGFVTDRPISPAELSGALRSAGKVRAAGSASGPGWTGTRYVFTVRSEGQQSLTAIVELDQQGQVRRMVTVITQRNVTTDRDLTFSDFGAPVPVTAPPASRVSYTSRPYWGFLF
jgi:hypothetical protein